MVIKKISLLSVILAYTLSQSALANHFGMAGCGLGSMLFKGAPGKTEILASTTNDFFGSQTFGITSASSGCYEDSKEETSKLYINQNRIALQKNISQGSGEVLSGLFLILGCNDKKNKKKLGETLQLNYKTIYSSQDVNNKIINIIKSDKNSSSCKFLKAA